ncbi:hypothetical protein RND81_04G163500 [Saponaria officinalis]|uniref:PUM-HD domain-containing protein n=1 Tax=Saponaria officinalis TaxID=3572 RepID=A0AAW1LF84_SAPOF
MVSELGSKPMIDEHGNNEESFENELEKEIGMLLHENRQLGQEFPDSARDRDLNMLRSGSAPPTVEGSLNAVGGLFSDTNVGFSGFSGSKDSDVGMSEEELRSDPAYLSYYYSNVNMNPRLPPPLLSKEDWRLTQRMQGGNSMLGGIGDRRKVNKAENGLGRSPSFIPPGFTSKKEERVADQEKVRGSPDWGKGGLPGIGLGPRRQSLAEIFQNDLACSNPPSRYPSRPASRNAFDENVDSFGSTETELALLRAEGRNFKGSSVPQNDAAPSSHSYAAVLGSSLSRNTTPDPQHIARVPSPCPTPIGEGRAGAAKKNLSSANGVSSGMSDSANLVASLSGMKLTTNTDIGHENHLPSLIKRNGSDQQKHLLNMHNGHDHGLQHLYQNMSNSEHLNVPSYRHSAGLGNIGAHESWTPQAERHKYGFNSGTSYTNGPTPSFVNGDGSRPHYNHLDGANSSFANYGMSAYSTAVPSMMASQLGNYNRPPSFESVAAASAMGVYGLDSDASLQYLRIAEYAAYVASLNGQSPDKLYIELLQKAYLDCVTPPKKPQFNKSSGSNHGFYGNHAIDIGMGQGNPIRHKEFNMRYPATMRNIGGGMVSRHVDSGSGSSLLEEFKSNKTKCFELSEIRGHVVEFSVDQYGSRFIQQKLETATVDEKNLVFEEINPPALSLINDVFGNYVIQKFFEHGTDYQRRELANKLDSHVLNLSLQMYGCRVIQKAIEVVDVDQKVNMVRELDGHIMHCVRDQNGNHVIQKCIECVPEEHIQFIVESFFDQVITLSTHPYGCRVIQRVLEHCKDPMTQNKVMDDILRSVSMLAQDQYGNYVIQHVLEHGKSHERTAIIKELAGKIVIMSQQKFASNVVEKCLTFGDAEEREILVNEMLGTTDENEPLQAMMKDQFANYVVQKVLETCSDEKREYILSRIKVHLNALKKYTYGKHIVARVEKLVAAGERRISAQTA